MTIVSDKRSSYQCSVLQCELFLPGCKCLEGVSDGEKQTNIDPKITSKYITIQGYTKPVEIQSIFYKSKRQEVTWNLRTNQKEAQVRLLTWNHSCYKLQALTCETVAIISRVVVVAGDWDGPITDGNWRTKNRFRHQSRAAHTNS